MKEDERSKPSGESGNAKSNWDHKPFQGRFRIPKHRPRINWRDLDHNRNGWTGYQKRSFYRRPFDHKHRGAFFFRLFGVFAIIVVLILGGMAIFAYLLAQIFEGGREMATMVWISGCSLSLALPMIALAVGMAVYRGVATPIADVMSAANTIAEGDFSVRVPVPQHGSPDFKRLVDSFNHMVTELSHLEQQRRNLTADVAHELRTPLHVIQGNLEGILDGVYQPTQEHINIMLDEIRMLTRLVNDLQILSLAEAGELPLNYETVFIPELLYDVQTSFSGQMETAKINIQVNLAGDKNEGMDGQDTRQSLWEVEADSARLDQVLTNLVANAMRHTKEGGRITLFAGYDRDGVIIQVQDTGEGISEEDLPFIFDRFWRGDRTRGRMEGTGSGLGLAISRKLIEAHDGDIDVQSKIHEGTTFTIRLPRKLRIKDH